jgi:hypothetical protein
MRQTASHPIATGRAGTGRRPVTRRLLAAALLIGAVLAPALTTNLSASATPVPVVDPPPGGGPITYETFEIDLGHLAPMGSPGDTIEGSNFVPRPVGAFGIKSISFDLVDAHTGLPIPTNDAWLHHFVIASIGADDPACPGHKVFGLKVAPMVGTGQERTPISFPDPYAILAGAKEQWGGLWHVMNMSDTAMDVKITYRIGLQKGATAANTRPLTPFWADSYACPGGTTWDIPGTGGPGSIETDMQSYTIPKDGIAVGIGGHLHGGGIDLVTRHEGGTVMCTNTAHYMVGMENMDGMIESISSCASHDTVTAGEKISVTSHYDNSAHHAEVMGIGVLYLWFGTQPPAAPTTTTTTTVTADPAPTTAAAPTSRVAAAVEATPRFTG